MNHKLLLALPALSIASSLLVAGLLTGQPAPVAPGNDRATVVQGQEPVPVMPSSEPAVPVERKERRRASLSMPYFSFAQSLRPRG